MHNSFFDQLSIEKKSIIQCVIIDWMLLVNSFTDISLIMVVCGEDASWAVGNVFVAVDQRRFGSKTDWFPDLPVQSS